MAFFNQTEPIIRSKQPELDIQDLKGLLKINLKLGNITILSSFYTRIDQVFLLWGWISLIIFMIAQFLPVSWITQAYWWSTLTIVGTLGMTGLSYYWVKVERVAWIVYWWMLLMVIGLTLTNFGIFGGWSNILMNLCPLWLGLCAFGYLGTGIGLRSRAFLMAGILHIISIPLLPYLISWQFLVSGLIMGGTLLFFAEVQWDMRSPIESYLLTAEELAFNQQQYQRRQINH